MIRLFRSAFIVVVLSVVSTAEFASACELCHRYATPMLEVDESHDHAGGDAGAGGFAPIVSKWPQPGGLGSPVYLTYSYQNMFDGGLLMPNGQPLPAALIKSSIEEALGLWASVIPVHFTEVEDNGLPYGNPAATYGQIRFRHVHINGPDPPPPADPIAKAQAYYPSSSVLGGDVEYDHSDRWQESGTRPIPDILGATIHELGHSLGLNHSNLPEANMYWIFTRYSGLGQGRLHADDITSMQANYGAGVGSLTPLMSNVPEPATMLLATISLFGAWNLLRRNERSRKTAH